MDGSCALHSPRDEPYLEPRDPVQTGDPGRGMDVLTRGGTRGVEHRGGRNGYELGARCELYEPGVRCELYERVGVQRRHGAEITVERRLAGAQGDPDSDRLTYPSETRGRCRG